MGPLDRIHQLADENAILRSQLRDAQEQAKRDTETIARLRAMPCAPTHETELRLRNTTPLENPTPCTL